ncbi:MAG TPA: hypothetical protein DHN29_20870 [Cytophagales bacterium]|jgi:hypothetical protein|nr:hypothetical protein [Cytophagales bacterium]|tara:strand:+ start:2905 stop:3204 length:300 start_codon:yes stop_codon:yes gene_type:complete
MTQDEYLLDFIQQKEKLLWGVQWELEFAKTHHGDLLKEGALEAARDELFKSKNQDDEDLHAEYEQKVNDVRDTIKVVQRLEQTADDLTAQIDYFKSLCI